MAAQTLDKKLDFLLNRLNEFPNQPQDPVTIPESPTIDDIIRESKNTLAETNPQELHDAETEKYLAKLDVMIGVAGWSGQSLPSLAKLDQAFSRAAETDPLLNKLQIAEQRLNALGNSVGHITGNLRKVADMLDDRLFLLENGYFQARYVACKREEFRPLLAKRQKAVLSPSP